MEAARQQTEDLAHRYQHRVRFFVRKVRFSFMLSSRWDDDLVSAGYWGLFKALDNRRPDAHEKELSAYVSQRIHGAVLDEARACMARGHARELTLDDGTHGEPRSDPEELAARRWKRAAIQAALDGLEAADRRIVVAYMEGSSLAEIAQSESISPSTMQMRFQKVSRGLRARVPELRRILLDQDEL